MEPLTTNVHGTPVLQAPCWNMSFLTGHRGVRVWQFSLTLVGFGALVAFHQKPPIDDSHHLARFRPDLMARRKVAIYHCAREQLQIRRCHGESG